ncbi:MAG TPA: branched-chain amino acid transaminase [bacterium]|nr:branched-chain amino acid transaminase [Myxococcales bacterium]OQA62065.1 MAG: Branched-chain-amino-acid aminotransferase [bacterium ADurb.Bin270]HPW45192.1 branched-chain amino acid transaminase [bacterium]HQC50897.1 branched-chain amino acid transaminase [bacterium]HQH80165.1 branched-chain amino acid transaminase [bacterium]
MTREGKKIWMDGEFVDNSDARVSVMSQTLHYGFGTFEGIRCYKLASGGSAIFRLKEHAQRMFNGLKILKMDNPFTLEQFIDAHIKTVKVNEFDECYLRPIMYCDAGSFGLAAVNRTRAAIVAREWGAYLGEGALENGIRAKISSFNRHHVNVGMVQGKICGQYTTSILAKREAIAGGYQEAIMLDTMGYVAEGTGENIFVVKDGVIITPPITSPILPGITRDTIIHVARNMNMEVREDKFTRDFVYLCDEVFVVGTAAEVTPVREVDDRPIGTGKPGPITQRLQKAYFDIVRGKDDYYKHWLSKI